MIHFRPIARHGINLNAAEIVGILAGMASDRISEGREQRLFEDEFARFHGRKYATAFSSGRSALYALIVSLSLPKGSEIIVPAYTFFTIPQVVKACGHVPVFAPCNPLNYAMDPGRLEQFISARTGAVIVIHPFGQPAPMDELSAIAAKYRIALMEDPSQSIGANYKGRVVGGFGVGACFSLVHGKNMTAFGGGIAVTDDERCFREALLMQSGAVSTPPQQVRREAAGGLFQWACTTRSGYLLGPFLPFYLLSALDREKLDSIFDEPREAFQPGTLRRLSNLQSALGRRQLGRLEDLNARRRRNAERLLEGLRDVKGLLPPETVEGGEGTWNSFPVRVPRAAEFQRNLMLRGIDTRKDYMDVCDFKKEWDSFGEVVYLPNHTGVSDDDVNYIVTQVGTVMKKMMKG